MLRGFPGSSTGKESTCNAGDPGSIPGSRSSPGERIGYPLQYSWASLLAQTVKNLPAMKCRKIWVQSLDWKDPLDKGKATHSSILAWRIPWTIPWDLIASDTTERLSLSLFTFMHWRRKWQPTPVFLPGEPQGRRSLVSCHLWGHTESDTTEQLSTEQHILFISIIIIAGAAGIII